MQGAFLYNFKSVERAGARNKEPSTMRVYIDDYASHKIDV